MKLNKLFCALLNANKLIFAFGASDFLRAMNDTIQLFILMAKNDLFKSN